MKKILINLSLLVIALFLGAIIIPIGFVYTLIKLSINGGVAKFFLDSAIGVDQLGNVMTKELLNDTLRKRGNGYSFGVVDETVSSALGKNLTMYTSLSPLGIGLNKCLNFIEKNHSIMAIEYDEFPTETGIENEGSSE